MSTGNISVSLDLNVELPYLAAVDGWLMSGCRVGVKNGD